MRRRLEGDWRERRGGALSSGHAQAESATARSCARQGGQSGGTSWCAAPCLTGTAADCCSRGGHGKSFEKKEKVKKTFFQSQTFHHPRPLGPLGFNFSQHGPTTRPKSLTFKKKPRRSGTVSHRLPEPGLDSQESRLRVKALYGEATADTWQHGHQSRGT
jgi:hypothetical protein